MLFAKSLLCGACLVALAILPVQARADAVGKIAAMYDSHSVNNGGATSSSSRLTYDLNLDYKFNNSGWVLGGTYQGDALGGSSSWKRSSFGPTLGWVDRYDYGFYVMFTYYPYSKYGYFSGGNGIQIDLGYKVPIGTVPVAFQLSYKHYSYAKYAYSESFVDPYFAVVMIF